MTPPPFDFNPLSINDIKALLRKYISEQKPPKYETTKVVIIELCYRPHSIVLFWDVYSWLRVLYEFIAEELYVNNKEYLDFRITLLGYSLPLSTPADIVLQVDHSSPILPKRTDHKMPTTLGSRSRVAIGGTFDRLHCGHKLLLSVAALISEFKVFCGITNDEMVKGKEYADLIEPYEERKRRVEEFFSSVIPGYVPVEIVQLKDPFGPTVEEKSIETLIVTPETLNGGDRINEIRGSKGMDLLELISVDLITFTNGERLSSTLLRSKVKFQPHAETGVFTILEMTWNNNEKGLFAASFVKFLSAEIGAHDAQKRESIQVAISCIKRVFDLNEEAITSVNFPDLSSLKISTPSSPSKTTKSSLPAINRNKEVTTEDKNMAEQHKNIGNKHLAAKRAEDAVNSYSEAISLDPNNAVYYSNRAAALTLKGEYENALNDCRVALEIDPEYAKAFGRMGAAFMGLGDEINAIESYEKASKLDPDNVGYQSSIDQARRILSQKDKKKETESSYSNINKSNPSTSTGSPRMSSPAGGPDLGSLLNNPEIMRMASQFMSDPNAMRNLMNNPELASMMQGMMGGMPPRNSPFKPEDDN